MFLTFFSDKPSADIITAVKAKLNSIDKSCFYGKLRCPKITSLFNQEKKLKPEAAIVYKNPPTLSTKLTNYKKLSQILPNTDNSGSYPCGKCALCGNFKNYKNMVKTVGSIISHSNSKTLDLKKHLTCKTCGIYVVKCKFCKMQYVGQTKNKFSTRWKNHRSF